MEGEGGSKAASGVAQSAGIQPIGRLTQIDRSPTGEKIRDVSSLKPNCE